MVVEFSKDFFQETRRVEELFPTDSYITYKSIEAGCTQSAELKLVFHDPPTGSRSVLISRTRAIYCSDAIMTRQAAVRKESMDGNLNEKREILYPYHRQATFQIAMVRMIRIHISSGMCGSWHTCASSPKSTERARRECVRCAVQNGEVVAPIPHVPRCLSRSIALRLAN